MSDKIKINEIMTVKQFPIIEEQLKTIKDKFELDVFNALLLPCTDESCKAVKDSRADITKSFKDLEACRVQLKN